jgi:hypothetical protein
VGDLRIQWNNIFTDISSIDLDTTDDVILWKFGNKGVFTVEYVYNALSSNDVGPCHKKIWKGMIPAKIKIFLWLVMNNAILTKDNLIRRKWAGNPTCHFCDEDESISHLLFQCSTAKVVWAVVAYAIGANIVQQCWDCVRNGCLMDKSFIHWVLRPFAGPFGELGMIFALKAGKLQIQSQIVCFAFSLMCYWAGLFLENDKEALVRGINDDGDRGEVVEQETQKEEAATTGG